MLQTYRVQSWLLPDQREFGLLWYDQSWSSPILPWHRHSRAGKAEHFWALHRGLACLCCAGVAQAVGSDLSLWGESRRESTESRYCVVGRRCSSRQKVAPRRARASTHAGLLHLLVPTEDSIIPDWESEVRLSVRSKLQVWLSCLWSKAHVDSEQGTPTQLFSKDRHCSRSALHLCSALPCHRHVL